MGGDYERPRARSFKSYYWDSWDWCGSYLCDGIDVMAIAASGTVAGRASPEPASCLGHSATINYRGGALMAYGDLPIGAPHKPNKGHEGGACNRERCQAEPALWFNHGTHKWYCDDCAHDIGEDVVNKRDWELRWRPACGHAQFETREQMKEREARASERKEAQLPDVDRYFPYPRRDRVKPQSESLKRLLGKARGAA